MKCRKLLFWALLSFFVLISLSMVGLAEEYKVVQASDILKQIESGEDVNLTDCRIIGELKVSKANVSILSTGGNSNFKFDDQVKVIESEIKIENSFFENEVDFSFCYFTKPVSFVGSQFLDNASFYHAIFKDEVDFANVNFSNYTNFKYTIFNDAAIFFHATFRSYSDFGSSTFKGLGNFMLAKFSDVVIFTFTTFECDSIFSGSTFYGSADFSRADFEGYTLFGVMNQNDQTTFYDHVYFIGTKFDTVDFDRTQFSKVSFRSSDFKEMWVSWDSLENSLVFDGSAYVKLIQNFRNLEQFEDADAAYFQYRKICQAEKSWIPFSKGGSKWCDILMWFTCGYGVKPFRAFGLGGLIVLIFSFIYRGFPTTSWCNGGDADSAQKSPIKTLLSLIPKINWPKPGISRLSDNKDSAQKVTFGDSFYFSMVTFSTIGYGDWYPKDNFRKWVMLEGLLGWITLGLFLVTLTNVMMRP